MTRPLMGPSAHAREDLGTLFPVVEQVEEDGKEMLVLGCPGQHRIRVTTARHEPTPKKGRCKVCPPAKCGATNRTGVACSLAPKHRGLHEGGACRWSYDAREENKEEPNGKSPEREVDPDGSRADS